MTLNVEEIILKSGLKLKNGKMQFPGWCKRIAIDVGLSSNAPQSAIWLKNDEELIVIGFEPIPSNIEKIANGSSEWELKIDPLLIGNRLFIFPVALGNPIIPRLTTMNETSEDPGCSSILTPINFEISNSVEVYELSLDSILDFFPWDKFPTIAYLKTDCQGYDLYVLQGCKKYLSSFDAITCEIDTTRYLNPSGSLKDFRNFIEKYNYRYLNLFFRTLVKYVPRISNIQVDDPTWIKRQLKIFGPKSSKIIQKG